MTDDNMMVITDAEGVLEEARKGNRRRLAGELKKQLSVQTFDSNTGKEVTKSEYMARMITDLITNGKAITIEGREISPANFREWFDMVKFVHSHLDGVPTADATFQGIQIFKVYAGVDMDKV